MNKLPFVLVQDVADALVRVLDIPEMEGESFNLVADPCLSAREYLEALQRCSGLQLRVEAVPMRRFYLTDMFKWIVKVLVRHPGRRMPSYRDWESRTQKAIYDCTKAKQKLGWRPTSDAYQIVRLGIETPITEAIR